MKTYEIEVRATGYDTTSKIVQAETLLEAARKFERQAVTEWIEHNDADEACRKLAFTFIALKPRNENI